MSIGQNTSGQLDKPLTSNPTGKGWWKYILPLVLMLAVLGTLMVANNASAGVVTNPVSGQNPDQASSQAPAGGQPQKSTTTNTNVSTKLAPPAAPYVILYDQYDNAGTNATLSQDFEPANDAFDSQLADDFVVPAGQTWTVTEVDAKGVYFGGPGPAISFNVFFYANSGTLPATPVYTATGLSYTGSSDFVITLTTPAVLPAGTYWVSPQARMDYPVGGEWGWQDRTVLSNSPAAFRNAGGGFACSGGNGWVVKTTCVNTTDPDQVYRLVGTIGGGGATNTPTNTPIATGTACGVSNPINEGFEGGLNTFSSVVGTCVPGGCGWTPAGNPHTGSGSAFAPDLSDISDQYLELTNAISIPAGSTSATLTFWHAYDLENTFDGGVLEVSTDGGTTWADVTAVGGSFISGGYDATISSNFGSPIAGRQAWTGAFTTYRQVSVNLNSLIGQANLKIRFREANDSSVAHIGWNVDDVLLSVAGSCGSVTATPTGPTATATATVCGTGGTPGPWATATTGPALRYRAGGTTDGTYVYVYGGSNDVAAYLNDLWRWDPATETWTQLANMPTGKSNIQGAYYNGKIYVPGGYIGSHITENAIYDIATNTWTTGAPLPAPQTGTTSAYNGKIYNIGGNPGPQSTVSIYDIATDTWSTGASLPTATTYGRSITVGAYIYYVGGIAGATTNAVYRYDIAADSWSTMAPLQTARTSEELMSTSDGSKIFAVMGGDASFFSGVPLPQTVEIYDIAANTWTYGNPVVVTAAAPSGGGAGGKLMVQGGVDGTVYYDTVQVSTVSGGGCGTGTPVATNTTVATNTPIATDTPAATATCVPGFLVVGPSAPATGNIPFKQTSSKMSATGNGAHGGTATVNLPFAPITFLLDDGTYESGIGWNDGSTESAAIWINRFTPPAGSYPITLNTVSIQWPQNSGGTLVGLQARILVYSDADGDGNPANATLLSSSLVTIASLDSFLNYTVNATINSGDIYVGFEDQWAESGYTPLLYPAAIDTDSTNNRSYVAAMSNGAPDYTNLGNNDNIGTIEDLSGGGISGNWLIRASGDTNVVPCATGTVVPPTGTAVVTGTAVATNTATETATGTPPTATATATACTLSFEDVPPNHTFYAYIQCLACRGIINGYPCGGPGEPCNGNNDPYFRPGNNVTRGQFSKIAANSAGFNEPAGAQQYEDVLPGSTFFDYIWRLTDRGLVNGYPCGGAGEPCGPNNLPYFRPNANVTRGQLSKIDANAAGLTQPAGAQQYEDVLPGSTFYDYIWRLTDLGIMNGYPCGGIGEPCGPNNLPYFRPGANATRGQASKIVANTFFPNCQVR